MIVNVDYGHTLGICRDLQEKFLNVLEHIGVLKIIVRLTDKSNTGTDTTSTAPKNLAVCIVFGALQTLSHAFCSVLVPMSEHLPKVCQPGLEIIYCGSARPSKSIVFHNCISYSNTSAFKSKNHKLAWTTSLESCDSNFIKNDGWKGNSGLFRFGKSSVLQLDAKCFFEFDQLLNMDGLSLSRGRKDHENPATYCWHVVGQWDADSLECLTSTISTVPSTKVPLTLYWCEQRVCELQCICSTLVLISMKYDVSIKLTIPGDIGNKWTMRLAM